MPITRAVLVIAAAIAVSFALFGAANAELPADGEERLAIDPDWTLEAESIDQLVAQSRAVVDAEVVSVSEGDPYLLDPGESGLGSDVTTLDSDHYDLASLEAAGAVLLPTQRIEFQVTHAIDGHLTGTFTLFKIGGVTPTGEQAHPSDDPSYSVGTNHLLFVERRESDSDRSPHPDGTYVVVSPDGRLDLNESTGELEANSEGEVAEQLEGETPQAAEAEIDDAATDGQQG